MKKEYTISAEEPPKLLSKLYRVTAVLTAGGTLSKNLSNGLKISISIHFTGSGLLIEL